MVNATGFMIWLFFFLGAIAEALKVIKITVYGQHTCALLDNNQVKCFGRNE